MKLIDQIYQYLQHQPECSLGKSCATGDTCTCGMVGVADQLKEIQKGAAVRVQEKAKTVEVESADKEELCMSVLSQSPLVDEMGVVLEIADMKDMSEKWDDSNKVKLLPTTCSLDVRKLARHGVYVAKENALLRAIIKQLEKKGE